MKIINIGPMAEGGSSGGVTLPFVEWTSYCRSKFPHAKHIVLSTSGRKALRTLLVVLLNAKQATIIAHLTWRPFLTVPYVLLIAKFLGARVIIRKFAGDCDLRYASLPKVVRTLHSFVLTKCNITFFETKYLTEWAGKTGWNAKWWPNSRLMPELDPVGELDERKGKLVYLGRVCEEKGLSAVLSFSEAAFGECTVDLWGPIANQYEATVSAIEESSRGRVVYRGTLGRTEVPGVLSTYEALVLPTAWASEGYPGVIIEAAMVGLPSCVSNMRGPAELISELGVGNVQQVGATSGAIAFSQADRLRLMDNAKKFSSEYVFVEVAKLIFDEGSGASR